MGNEIGMLPQNAVSVQALARRVKRGYIAPMNSVRARLALLLTTLGLFARALLLLRPART